MFSLVVIRVTSPTFAAYGMMRFHCIVVENSDLFQVEPPPLAFNYRSLDVMLIYSKEKRGGV